MVKTIASSNRLAFDLGKHPQKKQPLPKEQHNLSIAEIFNFCHWNQYFQIKSGLTESWQHRIMKFLYFACKDRTHKKLNWTTARTEIKGDC
jgi:hypothetical protein